MNKIDSKFKMIEFISQRIIKKDIYQIIFYNI